MTTIAIDLPPDKEASLKALAEAQGLTREQWLVQLAEQHAPPASEAHLQKTDPEEWGRRFKAWVDSHDPDTPILSDEAMSRESIHPDRTSTTTSHNGLATKSAGPAITTKDF